MNKNITILIPSHNDNHYLETSLRYYECFNYKIVICDSSKEKYTGRLPINVEYYHYKNMSYSKKILKVLLKIKTDYLAFVPVDDFILYDTLNKINQDIIFLKDNNYKMILGNYNSFKKASVKIIFNVNNANIHNTLIVDKVKNSYSKKPFNYNFEPRVNAELFMSNYFMSVFGIFEKKTFEIAFKVLLVCRFNNANWNEMVFVLVFSYFSCIIKYCDVLILRRCDYNSLGNRNKPLRDYVCDEDMFREYERLCFAVNLITEPLFAESGIDFFMKSKLNNNWKLTMKKMFN